MIHKKSKKNKKLLLLVALLAVSIFFAVNREWNRGRVLGDEISKNGNEVTVIDGKSSLDTVSFSNDVAGLLNEKKIKIDEHDVVFPEMSKRIFSGDRIIIQRAKKITVTEGGGTKDMYTLQDTIEEALWENKIDFGDDDFTKPARTLSMTDGMKIAVTHVQIKEEIKNEPIAFKTVSNEDDTLGWRIKKTTQKGVPGINEIKYKVVYYDGKEISRKVLEKNKTKDPMDEVVTQGTYMKLGKGARGGGTWYAFKGGLFAASRTLARGSFAKVTNIDNGQSVVVQINDYGPFGNGRIIDLDKVAFAKIADLGQGVIDNVKVEQVLN